jgi:uncharacterized protein YjbJ (UPF0337 family)
MTLMNWTRIEGQWHQLMGQAKSQWGKLTDSDLTNIAGKKQQLVGKLQESYGIMKEDAEKQINEWLAKIRPDDGADAPAAPVDAGSGKATDEQALDQSGNRNSASQ